tara:strand:+ start:206 stop:370 length:165 start_codon:yes stop_codon:yes gene_type:complete
VGIYNIGISWLVEVDRGEVELCCCVMEKYLVELDRDVGVVRDSVVVRWWNDVVV